MSKRDSFLVIGGGVAGSTCAVELTRLCPSAAVILVSPSPIIKELRGLERISDSLEHVEVVQSLAEDFMMSHPGIALVKDSVIRVDAGRGKAHLKSGGSVLFTRCCLATGASPALAAAHPNVIGIRDTESVEELAQRLRTARRVLVVGNGGIALELVHTLNTNRWCKVVWAVRDSYIGNTFFDATASNFIMPSLAGQQGTHSSTPIKPAGGSGTGAMPGSNLHVSPGSPSWERQRDKAKSGSVSGHSLVRKSPSSQSSVVELEETNGVNHSTARADRAVEWKRAVPMVTGATRVGPPPLMGGGLGPRWV
ncbi:unnamed protein product, partial [Discosporangium mesarthrocarpum]